MEAPQVADVPTPQAPTGPQIAGGGGLAFGGKFLGPDDGPMGAFHASVQRRFRKHYDQPQHEFATAEVVFDVAASGTVRSYRIQKSSGDPVNDDAVRSAAEKLRAEGVSAPPDGAPRAVLVKVIPY